MRIAVVGTSYWTEMIHGAGANAHPEWDLITVWGRNPEKADLMAKKLGCDSSTDYQEVLDQVDAVAFAVPPDVQAPMALQGARAGKHLLLEKPLALTTTEADELADAIDENHVANVVFFTRLWVPEILANIDRLAARGGWESGRFSFVASLPDGFLDSSPWRAQHGALWDVGPHILSVVERVMGEVTEVSAKAGPRDHVQLGFTHASGMTSSAEATLTAPKAAVQNVISFWGEHGISAPIEPDVLPPGIGLVAYESALSNLAHQIRSGERETRVGARYGAHVVHVLAAAQRSLGSGQREAV